MKVVMITKVMMRDTMKNTAIILMIMLSMMTIIMRTIIMMAARGG